MTKLEVYTLSKAYAWKGMLTQVSLALPVGSTMGIDKFSTAAFTSLVGPASAVVARLISSKDLFLSLQ